MIDEYLAETAQILARMEVEVLRYPRADGTLRDPNVFNMPPDTSSDSIPSGIVDAFPASAGTPGKENVEDTEEDIGDMWMEMEAREEEREQWSEMRGF